MNVDFDEKVKALIVESRKYAVEHGDGQIDIGHVFSAAYGEWMRFKGIGVDSEELLKKTISSVVDFKKGTHIQVSDPAFSSRMNDLFEKAEEEAKRMGDEHIRVGHLLLNIPQTFLKKNSIDPKIWKKEVLKSHYYNVAVEARFSAQDFTVQIKNCLKAIFLGKNDKDVQDLLENILSNFWNPFAPVRNESRKKWIGAYSENKKILEVIKRDDKKLAIIFFTQALRIFNIPPEFYERKLVDG